MKLSKIFDRIGSYTIYTMPFSVIGLIWFFEYQPILKKILKTQIVIVLFCLFFVGVFKYQEGKEDEED